MARILVVDDDAHIRQALVDRFVARKFDVSSAASGKDALSKISREHPDVVLLDLQLPEGDGFWVLKQLEDVRDKRKASAVDPHIASVDHVFDLVKTKEAIALEESGGESVR